MTIDEYEHENDPGEGPMLLTLPVSLRILLTLRPGPLSSSEIAEYYPHVEPTHIRTVLYRLENHTLVHFVGKAAQLSGPGRPPNVYKLTEFGKTKTEEIYRDIARTLNHAEIPATPTFPTETTHD